jgi:hypothetical protein
MHQTAAIQFVEAKGIRFAHCRRHYRLGSRFIEVRLSPALLRLE